MKRLYATFIAHHLKGMTGNTGTCSFFEMASTPDATLQMATSMFGSTKAHEWFFCLVCSSQHPLVIFCYTIPSHIQYTSQPHMSRYLVDTFLLFPFLVLRKSLLCASCIHIFIRATLCVRAHGSKQDRHDHDVAAIVTGLSLYAEMRLLSM